MIKQLLYHPVVNLAVRSTLKPLSQILSSKYKIPVSGKISVKGNGIEPFVMYTNPTNAVTKYLFWGGVEGFEFNSSKVICALAKRSKIFFDIGSNIGYYSLLISSVTNQKTKVFAFEPMPSIFDYLLKNCKKNGFDNIRCEKLALSDQSGKATFKAVVNKKFNNWPQLTGDGSLSDVHAANQSKLEFDVVIDTLDAYVNRTLNGELIDLIKLDTEANEHKVLSGGQNVLKNHRPIIQCEILVNQIESELETILSRYNYRYYRATDNGLLPVISLMGNTSKDYNYFLVPEEKLDWIDGFITTF